MVFDKIVKLAQGITGYYQNVSCGISCGHAWIYWRRDGYFYAISLTLNDLKLLIKFANSAINNVSLNHPVLKEAAFNAARKTLFNPRQKPTNRILTYYFRLIEE